MKERKKTAHPKWINFIVADGRGRSVDRVISYINGHLTCKLLVLCYIYIDFAIFCNVNALKFVSIQITESACAISRNRNGIRILC